MTASRVEQAARNNALWCEVVCRAHGVPGEFLPTVWLNRASVPRFYPNVVTLSAQDTAMSQFTCIQDLLVSGLQRNWSVKDSFGTLELAAPHFKVLFEAAWLWREQSKFLPDHVDSRLRWSAIHRTHELANWEGAWSGSSASRAPAQQPRLFLPALLDDPTVAFIAAHHDQKLVGGATANHSVDVVGLSNVFVPPEAHPVSFWAACISMICRRFPGLPIVTYGHGMELAIAQEIGFEPLQTLRVWTHL